MANTYFYGFRPWMADGSDCFPNPIAMKVASTYQAQDDTTTFSVDLRIGDPVTLVGSGNVELAPTETEVFGVIVGVKKYYDGTTLIRPGGNRLPGGTTYSGFRNASEVMVIPASKCSWAICVDDAVTATTEAAYNALIGQNVEHTCAGDSGTAQARPRVAISGAAATATFGWRIVDVPTNQDFAAADVQVIVEVNESQEAGKPASGSIVAGGS